MPVWPAIKILSYALCLVCGYDLSVTLALKNVACCRQIWMLSAHVLLCFYPPSTSPSFVPAALRFHNDAGYWWLLLEPNNSCKGAVRLQEQKTGRLQIALEAAYVISHYLVVVLTKHATHKHKCSQHTRFLIEQMQCNLRVMPKLAFC